MSMGRLRPDGRGVRGPVRAVFPGLQRVQRAFRELGGAVGRVDWEEDRAGLHHEYAWSKPHRWHEVFVDGLEFRGEN